MKTAFYLLFAGGFVFVACFAYSMGTERKLTDGQGVGIILAGWSVLFASLIHFFIVTWPNDF